MISWRKSVGINWSWDCISQIQRDERCDSGRFFPENFVFVIKHFLLRMEMTSLSNRFLSSSRRLSLARSSSPPPLKAFKPSGRGLYSSQREYAPLVLLFLPLVLWVIAYLRVWKPDVRKIDKKHFLSVWLPNGWISKHSCLVGRLWFGLAVIITSLSYLMTMQFMIFTLMYLILQL